MKPLGWIIRRRKPEAYADHAEHLKSWDPSSLLRDRGVVMSASSLAQNISELFYFLLLAFMAFMNDLMCYRAILMRHATSLPSPVASAANAPEVESKAWQSGTWAVVAFELQKSLGTQF